MTNYDVIVIGAGPAGYVAAIRCAQLGLKTACVDDWLNDKQQPALGGTCLNVGCIPSKALLESSEKFAETKTGMAKHGIEIDNSTLNLATMMARKNKIVTELNHGVAGLFKSSGVTSISGHGYLKNKNTVEVNDGKKNGNKLNIGAKNIILAPGSKPVEISIAPVDNKTIFDSAGALSFHEAPKRLGIIGAGVIGLELGSVWHRLGAEVVILEAMEEFLPMADSQISREALRTLKKQGLDIKLGTKVLSAKNSGELVSVEYETSKGKQTETFDKLIVAVGRKPNSAGLFNDDTGLNINAQGFIDVDDFCYTGQHNIYAIGDAVRGPMLAHKGMEEGVMVAEIIAGQSGRVNYETIPSVIYTHPEIAWAGKSEQQLETAGISFKRGSFPFLASGRAKAAGETGGLIKVLADAKTDRVLGVHMIGARCSEIIGQAVIAMEFGASSEDLAMTMFAHPTLSEVFHEAALAVDNRAIHMPNSKK
ncbi:MAG: dihydrolipoyl dehydrogenase [Acidiferrobacterales bacterium]